MDVNNRDLFCLHYDYSNIITNFDKIDNFIKKESDQKSNTLITVLREDGAKRKVPVC